MAQYRAHYLTQSGEIFGGEYFQASDDKSAIEFARKSLGSPWGSGHEIWRGERLVHREKYG